MEWMDMTRCQYMGTFPSPSVSKILTACWFKKTLFLGYMQKAEMHRFPLINIMGEGFGLGFILFHVVTDKYGCQKYMEKILFHVNPNEADLKSSKFLKVVEEGKILTKKVQWCFYTLELVTHKGGRDKL